MFAWKSSSIGHRSLTPAVWWSSSAVFLFLTPCSQPIQRLYIQQIKSSLSAVTFSVYADWACNKSSCLTPKTNSLVYGTRWVSRRLTQPSTLHSHPSLSLPNSSRVKLHTCRQQWYLPLSWEDWAGYPVWCSFSCSGNLRSRVGIHSRWRKLEIVHQNKRFEDSWLSPSCI